MTKLKLEAGKYYLTRDGRKVGLHINHKGGSDKWPFYHDCGDDSYHAVDQFGLSCIGCRGYDIIAEWTDTPTIGTLAEIGAQVGDVVEYVPDGAHYTVREGKCLQSRHGDLIEYGYFWGDASRFRIVSRASDLSKLDYKTINVEKPIYEIEPDTRPLEHFQSGPVITETVKRIVPGVYGKVYVEQDVKSSVSVGFVYETGCIGAPSLNRDDLTAAIETLTAIRDAL